MAGTKLYSGALELGVTTDTYDIEGRVTKRRDWSGVSGSGIREAASRFRGQLSQTPPAYSARKMKGKPMHRLVRQGIEVAPRPSSVTVFRFDILEISGSRARFEAETSAGTYVRSLVHDLGESLGCGAHLVELRRLASSGLRAEQAARWDEVLSHGRRGTLSDLVTPMERIDLGLPTARVDTGGAAALRAGRPIPVADPSWALLSAESLDGAAIPRPVRVLDQEGTLVGVALASPGTGNEIALRPLVVMPV